MSYYDDDTKLTLEEAKEIVEKHNMNVDEWLKEGRLFKLAKAIQQENVKKEPRNKNA